MESQLKTGKLKPVSDAFINVRYAFELNAYNEEFLLIFDLMEELNKISKRFEKKSFSKILYNGGKVVVKIEN